MQCRYGIGLAVMMIAIMLAGCGSPAGPPDSPQASGQASSTSQGTTAAATDDSTVARDTTKDPAATVYEFLDGIRRGDDKMVSHMMTKLAREKIGQLGYQVAPRRSDTARFEVGKVEYLGDNGARVTATWSDMDPNHRMQSDGMVWVVRKDPEGWRILGMAAEVFPGEDPLLLNFEEPEKTQEKLQWYQDEVRRRAAAVEEKLQAKKAENSPEKVQR